MEEYEDQYEYEDIEDTEITAEDCWMVISSFFESKGLVSQQLDSYDEFVATTIQDLVNEQAHITIDQNNPPSPDPDNPIQIRRYELKFGRLLISEPRMTEGDGSTQRMLPHEARLRNLTYSSALYIRVYRKVSVVQEQPIPLQEMDEEQQEQMSISGEHPTRPTWIIEEQTTTHEEEEKLNLPEDEREKPFFIGKMPVMLKSKYCILKDLDEDDLYAWNECPYDQGGYFIINGSEKVLIAQERSAANIVQVFKKPPPSPTPYIAEIRSALEKGSRLISSLTIKLYAKGDGQRGGFGQTIKSTLPYVKSDIPIAIVFRALGIVSDEDILNHVCYDRNDTQMLEMMKPCIEEAFVIQDREVALDFIGKRGASTGATRDKRIKNARDVMQKELLPHISQKEGSETRKAFFLGYMVHKLLQCALGRRETDDRDHFGKKRLDLAGPLIAKLFRNLFKRLTGDLFKYIQRCIENRKEFNPALGIKATTITNGLKYSLATGNWGDQKKAASSTAGVSQVLNRYTFSSTLSHLRRTNTPIGRDGKIAKPRQLHNTHWGLVCPAETPEGQACGLVKNLSLMCYVTVGAPSEPIVEFMIQRSMEVLEEYEPLKSPNATKVFVNGVWVGVHRDPQHLVETVQDLRRSHLISYEVSLIRDIRDREFKIFTDAGRVCRPLFVVNNKSGDPNKGDLVLKKDHIKRLQEDLTMPLNMDLEEKEEAGYYGWQGLINDGVIEYLDAEEEETVMIVMTPEDLTISRQLQMGYEMESTRNEEDQNRRVKAPWKPTTHIWTHCEIHPSMILGICASIIPFPDHNQASISNHSHANYANKESSLLVTLTNLLWVSKLWESSSQIISSAWIPWRTSFITLKSLWQPQCPWSTLSSVNCPPGKTPLSQFSAILATIRKIPSL
jgi:DNA-directed RNA polymerase II subunit RPB2